MKRIRQFLKASVNKKATCNFHDEKLKPHLRPLGNIK